MAKRFSDEKLNHRKKILDINNPRSRNPLNRVTIKTHSNEDVINVTSEKVSKKSYRESRESIKTGASLIPDLNIIVERMRNMPDDRFIYLTYMIPKSSEYYTPYSLQEYSWNELPNKLSYFTMSRHGVTYWHLSENFFTPLLQWQQEFQQFLSVIKIRTFAVFRLWKCFKLWEKTVKWRKQNQASQYLEEHLFVAIPHLATAILKLRTEIVLLEKSNFINVEVIENWHPFYFMEIQMKIYEKLIVTLRDFREKMKHLLYDACLKAITARGFFPTDEINYYPSIKKMRDAMSFMDRAKKRNFCKVLSNFLSYCDHMMHHLFHKIASNSFMDLVESLKVHDELGPNLNILSSNQTLHEQLEPVRPEGSPQNPFFVADFRLLPDRIEIEPSEDVLKHIFKHMSTLILDTVTKIDTFTDDKIYLQFTEPSIMGRQEERLAGVAPDLSFLLRNDKEFQFNRKSIFTFITLAFEKAKQYTLRFETIRNNYEVDTQTDPSTIKTEKDLLKLRAYCERYYNNVKALDGILTNVNLGLLKLSQGSFKNTVTPVCVKLQNVLATYLPKLASEQVERISQNTHNLSARLLNEPTTSLDIVAHIRFLDVVDIEMEHLFHEIDYTHDLFIIIKDYLIPIEDESKEDYMNCEDLLNRTNDKLKEIQAKRDQFVKQLEGSLNKDINLLFEEIHEVYLETQNSSLLEKSSNRSFITSKLSGLFEQLQTLQQRSAEYTGYQKEFQIDVTTFGEMDQTFNEIRLREKLYSTLDQWEQAYKRWTTIQFNKLVVSELVDLTVQTIRNCTQFEKYLPANDILPELKEAAENFKLKLPVIGYLSNSNLKARHWSHIEAVLDRKLYQEENIFLSTYEKQNAFDEAIANSLMEISAQASGEAQLENMLKSIEDLWDKQELTIVHYRDEKDVYVLAATEELQTILDDSHVNVNTIAASKYVAPIKQKVNDWISLLDQFGKTLEVWIECQSSWMYLEAIFVSLDIQRQLPQEARMFFVVDKSFKDLLRNAKKVSLALPVMASEENYDLLKENNRLLELITRGLQAYLEVKRVVFPRFYFLSNGELLEIMAQTRVPQTIQPHLRKCFDAIYRLEFGQKDDGSGHMTATNDILAFVSPEGEKLFFQKGLKARGAVEEWLRKVEEGMFASVKRAMRFGYQCYPHKERDAWFQDHPNQVVLTITQQQWANDIHLIFDNPDYSENNITDLMKENEKKCLKNLTALAALTRQNLTSLSRKVLTALITIDVHAKDMVRMLIDKNVVKSTDFDWLKILRFYWTPETETIYSVMTSATIPYYYEYLGAGGVLVLTPLTDRCYLCLMGAIQMDLGGAAAGPAGTGKTETTKDLAKAIAKQCVVFNCSDGLNCKMMGRFFSGLAQCGAWCCFDEFNRIDIEVLSVIAQQLITIRNAKIMNSRRFIFEGREIRLNKSCAVFITMNPGYAGRSELPDNLKALFRPIAMMIPDYALIAEVILYSEGFEDPKNLAQKMVHMYKLCSEQLSQQNHYDFGMRAIKSVLVMAGSLKRKSPDQREDITLIAALKDANIPKFLPNDVTLFLGILSDLFPGVDLPDSSHPDLEQSIAFGLSQKNLQVTSSTLRKCIQVYETMCVRWGVMLVGPTGGGKSTILHALEFALGNLYLNGVSNPNFRPVSIQCINPKAVTMNELYGYVNPKTLEWEDGLLGLAMRAAVNTKDEIHQWIINDGPVDAGWIENINTVLDDNKMLCLANSERIKLTAWMHMLFEVEDLMQASPATVSRCGMIFVDPDDLGWLPLLDSWSNGPIRNKIQNAQLKYLYTLFNQYFDTILDLTKRHGSSFIAQVSSAKVLLCLELLFALIEQIDWHTLQENVYTIFLNKIFIWCVLWSQSSNFLDNEKLIYEQLLRQLISQKTPINVPEDGTLWDYRINMATHNWEPWSTTVDAFVFNPKDKFYDMHVPTLDTTKYGFVTELLFRRNHPVMFTGETGVGKTVLAVSTLSRLKHHSVVPVQINFSAQTSSKRTQEMIEATLEKRRRNQLAAPIGKKVIIFIDDVNMPKLDTYGSQPPIELLRQFLDFKGFYDREKLFWKEIVDVVLGCSCAPLGGGRNYITPRFVRHFALLSLPKPNNEILTTIFSGILIGFFGDFTSSIQPLSIPIVNACVDVYTRIAKEMLPTPDKSHYIFNLRDLSKCIQGILQASNQHYNMEMQILRLFYHETTRVYHDRLVDDEDKSSFKNILKEICVKHFNKQVHRDEDPPILFGDFMVFGKPKCDRVYEEIKDYSKLQSVLMDYVDDYNSATGKAMNLIMFQDALEHTIRLARLLRSDRGNGLLVGAVGMGKQSLTKLAAHVNEYKCMEIELKRNYNITNFHEDLRVIYRHAGIDNIPIVFLMIDTQIIEEEFLEDINNLLDSGEVPNLFEGEEYEKIILDARDQCNAAVTDGGDRGTIYKFFINQVRNNLHVVLAMSPVGDAFRRRCRMFPSLINCTTIDWFSNWPTEALYSVAVGLLEKITTTKEECHALATATVFIHKTVENASQRYRKEMKRHYYATPSSYLELLKLYQNLLKNKSDELKGKRNRILSGLNKILQTNDTITIMQKELEVMVPQLDEKSANLKSLLERLDIDTKMADRVKENVVFDEVSAKEKADVCQAMSDDANKDLEIAMPALREAENALKNINKTEINELKSFATPPELVQFVMEAVCILLGVKTTWASAKAVLADINFVQRLFDYDKEHIKEETLKKLKKYISHKDFVPAKIEKVSKVAKTISLWVIAMDKFAKVYKVVEPKIQKKELAEAELKEVMAILRVKQQELAAAEAKIQNIMDNIDRRRYEFKTIQEAVDLSHVRINRAGRLISALSDEKVRWQMTVQTLTQELACLPGDVLVAAACVAYLGAFSIEYRNELTSQWLMKCQEEKIPSSTEFCLLRVLSDAYEIRQWNLDGLPKDDISVENGIYATKALRWPLIIDPQEQANHWIRNMEKNNNLQILKMNDANLLRITENCIRQGYPLLLEDLSESIDPSIRPVLQRETYVLDGKTYLKLGEVVINYNANFKLYMTTKLANPHYLPEICINVTLLNFLVTEKTLEDQLLSEIVAIELPVLEKQRNDLIIKINNDKQQLVNLEEKVLKLLFHSKGNILDDEELVETLNDSKETSLIIATRLEDTEESEKLINLTREKYRNLASRGAMLYFVVAGLADIDPMYQYSLKYFLQIFCAVIRLNHSIITTDERVEQLKTNELKAIYDNISRGLFENHKVIFSFLLSTAIEKQELRVTQSELYFLTRGVVGAIREKTKPNTIKLSDSDWECCLFLEDNFSSFEGFSDRSHVPFYIEIDNNREIFRFSDDETAPTDYWNNKLTNFQKLMLVKTFKKNRFVLNVIGYLRETIGPYFTEDSTARSQLKVVFQDTSNVIPLIFVLSTGSDPMAGLMKFADDMEYTDKLHSISLGQGQGPVAESLIDKGSRLGHWIFLQNCHLATSWMAHLENIVRNITLGVVKPHEHFRLFLSSMPHKSFPISVLQNSVKLTNESPKGIKANILHALADINEDYFEHHALQEKWRAIVFGLCVFHTVILERRKFGALGWNITYEFNESDRECGLKILEFFINRRKAEKIPWEAFYYINSEITWGGRVTDYWDQRCLRTILRIFTFEKILEPKYKYCRGDPYYCDPRKRTLQEYKDYVQHFPTLDDTEIFGMNENANLVFQTKETNLFVSMLVVGQPSAATEAGQTKENDICLEIISKIQEVLVYKISKDTFHPELLKVDAKGQLPSLTTVLVQEVDRYNNSMNVIHTSLVSLQKSIKGLIVMSEELEEVFQSILGNFVPKLWERNSFLTLKSLPNFIADFQRRIDFIQSWANFGSPKSYWISGFYFPQSFLTGILQTYARKQVLPIDKLKFDFQVTDNFLIQQDFFERNIKKKPVIDLYGDMPASSKDGINVHGIFVEAAEWRKAEGGLCDARVGILYSRLPVIRFVPCLQLNTGDRYEAPLYKTQSRSGVLSTTGRSSNFVLSILLESCFPSDFWILRGTALVSSVSDNIS